MSIKEVVIAIFTIIIDQIIKSIMQIYNVHLILINNILSIDYCYNQGAAWNILSGHLYLLILITIIMLVVIYSLMFSYKENKLTNLSSFLTSPFKLIIIINITPTTIEASAILNTGKLPILIKSLT